MASSYGNNAFFGGATIIAGNVIKVQDSYHPAWPLVFVTLGQIKHSEKMLLFAETGDHRAYAAGALMGGCFCFFLSDARLL